MEISDLTLDSSKKCREIKREILRFGVNQLEIQQLIKLLALELEDRNMMLSITNSIDREEVKLLIPEEN